MPPRLKETVVSIHGINSNGAWQERLKPLFEPHFTYEIHKYKPYRWAGGTVILLGRWWPLYAVILVPLVSRVPAALVVVYILAAFALCVLNAWALRRKVINAFAAKLPFAAHILAHSFGTFIAGTALRENPAVTYGQVILFGAVLDRNFPWGGIGRSRVLSVRNEVGAKDRIAKLAAFAARVDPRFGESGWSGFQDAAKVVHTINSPTEECRQCEAFVHNVIHPWLDHGTLNDTVRQQAVKFWLPYLWRYNPGRYQEFVSLCLAAAGSRDPLRFGAKQQQKLLSGEWEWFNGGVLVFIKRLIQHRRALADLPQLRGYELNELAIRVLSQAAILIAKAAQKGISNSSQRQGDLRYLCPIAAVTKSVEALAMYR